ncbi:MAG TPA: hypothetical protein VGM88_13550 [Kofleriaceae bacterium]|jgi:hypothetical protein
MESLIVGDLRIEALQSAPTAPVQLLWRGKSNNRHPGEALGPYFKDVLAAAGTSKVPVELHFEKLDHFNSSTITAIIQLIQESRARGIKLVLVYDQSLKWQKLSFDALKVFAKDDLLELRPA